MSRQAKNKCGEIPLHFAAAGGHLHIFQLLLKDDGKADISISDSHGHSPLHYAVYNNRTEVVKHIVQYYPGVIDLVAGNPLGKQYTALDFAKQSNIKKILFNAGAKSCENVKKLRKKGIIGKATTFWLRFWSKLKGMLSHFVPWRIKSNTRRPSRM